MEVIFKDTKAQVDMIIDGLGTRIDDVVLTPGEWRNFEHKLDKDPHAKPVYLGYHRVEYRGIIVRQREC